MSKLLKKIKNFNNRNKKSIFLIPLVFILMLVSFGAGVYTFYYKIFPFNASKKIVKKINFLKTAYNDIELEIINTPSYSKYGGIDLLNDQLIYVQGNGEIFVLNDDNNNLSFKKINSQKLPINKEQFINKYEKKYGTARLDNGFGVKDILIEKFNTSKKDLLILSSLDYDVKDDCYQLSLFLSEFIDTNKVSLNKWKKIYSSKDCLSLEPNRLETIPLASIGGRIIKYDKENILLSIGYFGDLTSEKLSQDLTNHYGKIIKINLKDFSNQIFSYGHRNPQGLSMLDKKNILSTEHGPKTGDELNHIIKDKNYGWPVATYGTDYGKKLWKQDITNNSHNGFEKPIYSWGNTYAASQLIFYKSNYFDKWKNNILITSLAANTLTRMIYDKEKKSVLYVENILIDKRIRDIVETPNGQIILLTDQTGGIDGYNQIPEIIFLKKKVP